MKRPPIAGFAMLALTGWLGIVTTGVAAADSPSGDWLKVAKPGAFELDPAKATDVVRLPVSLPRDVKSGDVLLERLDAYFGQKHDAELLKGFTPRLVEGQDGAASSIEIEVSVAAFAEPGAYTLLLRASRPSPVGGDASRLTQDIEVELQFPAEPLVRLLAGAKFEIVAGDKTTDVRVPVAVRRGLAAADLRLELVDVALSDRHEPSLIAAFTPQLTADQQRGSAILLQMNLDQVAQPGEYDLLFIVYPPEKLARVKPQEVKLKVVHPEAQLSPPKTLIIERVCWCPTNWSDEVPTLALHETSRKSRLSPVAVTQTGPATLDNVPQVGRVAFPATLLVQRGQVTEAEATVSGNFPLGTVTGSLEVSAPQLRTPVPVNFEVRSRVWLGYLGLTAFLGLALGYLLRVVSLSRIEALDQQKQAQQLLRRLMLACEQNADEPFQQKVKGACEALRNELGKGGLKDAIESADKALRDAQQSLQKDRAEAEKLLADLGTVVCTPWSLPQSLAEELNGRKATLEQALAALNAGQVNQALQTGKQQQDFGAALVPKVEQWQSEMRAKLAALREAAVPASLGDAWHTDIDALATRVRALETTQNPSPLTLVPAVDAMHRTLRNTLRYLALRLGDVAFEEARDVTDHLSGLELAQPASVQGLIAAVKQAATRAGSAAGLHDPDIAALDQVKLAIDEIDSAFRGAILGQTGGGAVAPAAAQAIAAVVNQRKYPEAAQLLAEAISATLQAQMEPALTKHTRRGELESNARIKQGPGAMPLPGPTNTSRASASWLETVLVAAATQLASPLVFASTRDRVDEPLEVLEARTKRALFGERFGRWLITALLTVLVAYGLFAERYVGTFSDFTMVFFWGFACDVSVETLTELAKGMKKR
jgi:hypothetical protein